MAVKLTDFVKVKLTKDTILSSGRNKKVAYLSDTVPTGKADDGEDFSRVYTSLTEIKNVKKEGRAVFVETGDVYKACKVFFDCGGKGIYLVSVASQTSEDNYKTYIDAINNLPLEVIAFSTRIGYVTGGEIPIRDGGLLLSDRKYIVEKLGQLEENGTAYRKLVAFDITDLKEDIVLLNSSNTLLKLVEKDVEAIINPKYEYSCMSILAHLSRIDLDNPASISDYCFTREVGLLPVTNKDTFVWDDISKNINVVLDIFGGVPTNFGGNTGAGIDLVEEFMVISIAQDVLLTEIQLLQTKLREDNAVPKIHSALISVLETYYTAGFLIQDVYEGEDILINKGGINYKVLNKGDVITGGYLINILPTSSRTQTEIANRSLPDVHIVLNTFKGIRQMNNIGKVI